MSKFNHKIPGTLIPIDDICVPLQIPNDPDYIELVIRAIRLLTLDRHYERDEANSAITVREQWFNRTYQPFIEALASETRCGGAFYTGEIDCYTYPLYAPFIGYSPSNPFTDPNYIPPGWLSPPFYIYDGMGSLPPAYQQGDIIVPFSAITLDPFDLFGGNLPTVQITVVGDGQVELDLLAIANGSLCAVSLNAAPSLAEILAGVFSPGTVVIDTNLDIASLPAEDDVSIQHEIDITAGTGIETTIFLTFMPIIDDQIFTPLRFGGGIRSVQLCGFESAGVIMGITDLRITNCGIEVFQDGVWTLKADLTSCVESITDPIAADVAQNAADILTNNGLIQNNTSNIAQNAADISQNTTAIAINTTDIGDLRTDVDDHENRITALENAGGGGGALDIVTTKYNVELSNSTTTSSTSYVNIGDSVQAHTFTRQNALIMATFLANKPSGGNLDGYFRLNVGGNFGDDTIMTASGGVYLMQVNHVFTGLINQSYDISLDMKAVSGSVQIADPRVVAYVIVEYGALATAPDHVIDFSASGWGWQLDASSVGSYSASGGNPDDCVIEQSAAYGDSILVIADDISETQIEDIRIDVYIAGLASGKFVTVALYIGGLSIQSTSLDDTGNNQWNAISFATLVPGAWPRSHTPTDEILLKVQSLDNSGTIEMRVDNIVIDVTP